MNEGEYARHILDASTRVFKLAELATTQGRSAMMAGDTETARTHLTTSRNMIVLARKTIAREVDMTEEQYVGDQIVEAWKLAATINGQRLTPAELVAVAENSLGYKCPDGTGDMVAEHMDQVTALQLAEAVIDAALTSNVEVDQSILQLPVEGQHRGGPSVVHTPSVAGRLQ